MKDKVIVVLKRVVASIGVALSVLTLGGGIHDFDKATDGLGLFKGLFWIIVGAAAIVAFAEDFREKKWPLEG